MGHFENQTVFITGGSRGIGLAIALKLVQQLHLQISLHKYRAKSLFVRLLGTQCKESSFLSGMLDVGAYLHFENGILYQSWRPLPLQHRVPKKLMTTDQILTL
jgi:NADP-dependent 3-hydroxy acid dehydrogenase YdfG